MPELRRLLIDPPRFNKDVIKHKTLILRDTEIHYIKRVLRLQKGCRINIVDGIGHLWESNIQDDYSLSLESDFKSPLHDQKQVKPLIALAVVVPRRGFKDILRICCELGVDIIQPLISDRSYPYNHTDTSRWLSILKEATEQSERLWLPSLFPCKPAKDFFLEDHDNSIISISHPRSNLYLDIPNWMNRYIDSKSMKMLVTIGPEGGWSEMELLLAKERSFICVTLGENILTTSTAAIASVASMVSCRRQHLEGS